MKKMKRVLIGTLLVFTLCMLTACGNDNNNAADEVPNNTNDVMDNAEDGTADRAARCCKRSAGAWRQTPAPGGTA